MRSLTDGASAIRVRRGADQARTIAGATFDGFLQSDLVPQGMQATALIWAAAFLVGPALFFPAQYLAKYPFIRRYHPEQLERVFWDDRLLFLLMSAGAMGVICGSAIVEKVGLGEDITPLIRSLKRATRERLGTAMN